MIPHDILTEKKIVVPLTCRLNGTTKLSWVRALKKLGKVYISVESFFQSGVIFPGVGIVLVIFQCKIESPLIPCEKNHHGLGSAFQWHIMKNFVGMCIHVKVFGGWSVAPPNKWCLLVTTIILQRQGCVWVSPCFCEHRGHNNCFPCLCKAKLVKKGQILTLTSFST